MDHQDSQPQENQIAVFIDFENIALGVESRSGRGAKIDFARIFNRLNIIGRVVIKRAYADFSRFTQYREQLMSHAISCIHMFSLKPNAAKNGADIRIAVDVMEALFAYPNLTHIAIISGDSDFTPVVQKVREQGRYVIGIGVRGSVSRYLIQSCNEFIYYGTLLKEETSAPQDSDIDESRALLRSALDALYTQHGEAPRAGQVKSAMIRLDPSFSEANFGFKRFTDFLRASDDIVDIKRSGNDFRVLLLEREEAGKELTLENARDLLVETINEMRAQGQTRPSATLIKTRILQKRNDFDERKLGYRHFAQFLREQKDLIRVSSKKK